jgi:signal recognition particle subunit SRP54
MGSVNDLMSKIPGMGQMAEQMQGIDADAEVKRIKGIIDSMTPDEREDPHKIDIQRRKRIAQGAGVDPSDVSGLVKQFDAMAAVVKQMAQMTMMDKLRAFTGLGKAGAFNPGAKLFAAKQGTGKRLTPKERAKLQKLREKEERRHRREMRDQRRGNQPGA